MEKLKSYFESVGFNKESIDKICSCFKQKQFQKGDLFVQGGKTCLQLGFLEAGQLQYFSISDRGDERTTYISLPNTFVASLLTYLTETPARENIRALTYIILWAVEKKDVIALQNDIPGFKDFYIKLIEWQVCCIDKAKFCLKGASAQEQ